ncbi:hypothetical protein FKW77_004491 [Venturia effusa]|uniref:N-acetylglucosaminylphosphatidylinositol deacetylase n=1 Tax=Venturia effusa TaxID=50376 RepID=A0A517L348_9PEZI|nr:hypothetical protein FKW77_004491 [Venturia effusa]
MGLSEALKVRAAQTNCVPVQAITSILAPAASPEIGDSYTNTAFDPHEAQPSPSDPFGNDALADIEGPLAGGPNWAEDLTFMYTQKATLSYDYAYNCGTVDNAVVPSCGPGVRTIVDQVENFAQTLKKAHITANDANIQDKDIDPIMEKVAKRYMEELSILYSYGVKNFLLLNVPPFDRTPQVLESPQSNILRQRKAIASINDHFSTAFQAWQSSHPGIKSMLIDTMSIFNEALDDPMKIGDKNKDSTAGSLLWKAASPTQKKYDQDDDGAIHLPIAGPNFLPCVLAILRTSYASDEETSTPGPKSPLMAASPFNCQGGSLYIVAHADDDILFQNPDLLAELQDRTRCVTSLYLTAGDAGLDLDYVKGREKGSKAAYSFMMGSDTTQLIETPWTTTTGLLADQRVVIETYNENPNVQHVWLRIPDGNYMGIGYLGSNYTSIKKLYTGEIEEIRTLPIIDVPVAQRRRNAMVPSYSSYTLNGLKRTISELVILTKPVVVRTQDWQGEERGDHSDHYTTAKLVQDVVGGKGIEIVGASPGQTVSAKESESRSGCRDNTMLEIPSHERFGVVNTRSDGQFSEPNPRSLASLSHAQSQTPNQELFVVL